MRSLRFRVLSAWLTAALLTALTSMPLNAESSDAERWLEHANLAPDFHVAETREKFQQQREGIRAELWKLVGALPPRSAPVVRTVSREELEHCRVERFEFENGAGATVPGVVFLPKNLHGKAPAILWNHWHGGEYDSGKRELFETRHTPFAPGPELASRGYVVMGIDAYCFGERNGRGPGGPEEKGSSGEMSAAKFNLWVGRTLWGMIVRDDLMALDYLCSRPEVDSARIGVTGISMGATRTWWLMALDDRPKAAVAVCCLTRYRDLIEAQQLRAHGIYYFVPGMLAHFDTEAVISCMAPRAFLSLAGELDAGSPVAGIKKIEAAAAPAWRLWEKREQFRSVIQPGVGHVYTPEMWQQMLDWFQREL